MYGSVLIANRGEIARRVARTARRLNMQVIAVASEIDRDAPHAREADECVVIAGEPRAAYLDAGSILVAAQQSGAECIHPGYGFLSENPDFADACEHAGIVFVGPPAEAMRALGHKDSAKRLMADAGLPLVPGYDGEDQSAAHLALRARETGYPLMIKAVAGGGGKGMRRVDAPGDFAAALEACRREAASSFHDDRVLLERCIEAARHIEFQIMADRHGRAIHLLERDCSLQRRHQKIIEEAPAVGMNAAMRAALGEGAIRGALAAGYVGAGTVEFIATADLSSYYFLEMNTRLQVEHPVTEMITGLDLVELQFRMAAGEPLPLSQKDVRARGHAVEARLYAEDPLRDFVPQTGRLFALRFPGESPVLRIETGVEAGSEVTAHYDPMIAKLIAHGDSREEAFSTLKAALEESVILGVRTNQAFLSALLEDRTVRAGRVTTAYVGDHLGELAGSRLVPADRAVAAATWHAAIRPQVAPPWDGTWALAGLERCDIADLLINGDVSRCRFARDEMGNLRIDVEGDSQRAAPVYHFHHDTATGIVHLSIRGRQVTVAAVDQLARTSGAEEGGATILAPMTGRIARVLVEPGASVKRGTPMMVVEAMKMEHILRAGIDGRVASLPAGEGMQVAEGTLLCRLEPVSS